MSIRVLVKEAAEMTVRRACEFRGTNASNGFANATSNGVTLEKQATVANHDKTRRFA